MTDPGAIATEYTPPTDHLSPEEQERLAGLKAARAEDFGYLGVQTTRPQSIAYGLTDSPVTQLTWIVEKVKEWTDPAKELPEDAVDLDQLLTLVSVYWFGKGGAGAANFLYESMHAAASWGQSHDRPQGFVAFGEEPLIRRILDPTRSSRTGTSTPRAATSRRWRSRTCSSTTSGRSSRRSASRLAHRCASAPSVWTSAVPARIFPLGGRCRPHRSDDRCRHASRLRRSQTPGARGGLGGLEGKLMAASSSPMHRRALTTRRGVVLALAGALIGMLAATVSTLGANSGTVDGEVTVEQAAACLLVSTGSIDFGTLALGTANAPGSPEIVLTNCGEGDEALLASGTNATGTNVTWNLVDSAATCADTLGNGQLPPRLGHPGGSTCRDPRRRTRRSEHLRPTGPPRMWGGSPPRAPEAPARARP